MRERLSPWADAWLRVLTDAGDRSRVRRGIRYARNGHVKLRSVESGLIIGFVAGSRARPYEVAIRAPVVRLDPFLRMSVNLAYDPTAMRSALEHVAGLLPRWEEVEALCSCPDWGAPCKHVAAVWYDVAQAISEDSRKLLTFRGIKDEPTEARYAGADAATATRTPARPEDPSPSENEVAATGDSRGRSRSLTGEGRPIQGTGTLTTDGGSFWEGDPSVWDRRLEGVEGPNQVPLWVFQPPMPWPSRQPTYAETMVRLYDAIRLQGGRFVAKLAPDGEAE